MMLIHYMDTPSRRLAVPIHSPGWMKKWSKVTSCLRKWCDSNAWTKTYRSNPLNLLSTTPPNKNALIQKAKQHICNLYCFCWNDVALVSYSSLLHPFFISLIIVTYQFILLLLFCSLIIYACFFCVLFSLGSFPFWCCGLAW